MTSSSTPASGNTFWENNPHAAQLHQWVEDPFVGRAIGLRISGGKTPGHWLGWLFNQHFAQRNFSRVLSIGCGVGDHELAMAAFPQIAAIDAFDFSNNSIAIARQRAQQQDITKIHFFSADFNTVPLPAAHYDLILCSGSLHHVKELEHLLGQVRHALKPGGIFIANEYIGACYNFYNPAQLDSINQVLAGLPESLQSKHGARLHNPTIEEVYARDPSEAVRARLIPEFLRIYFPKVEERPYGGALLHPLYPFLNSLALQSIPAMHQALMHTLILMDEHLMRSGKSDFSFFICEN